MILLNIQKIYNDDDDDDITYKHKFMIVPKKIVINRIMNPEKYIFFHIIMTVMSACIY